MTDVRSPQTLSRNWTDSPSRWLAVDAPACFAAFAAFAFGSNCWQEYPTAVMLFAALFVAGGLLRSIVAQEAPGAARRAAYASALAWSAVGCWAGVAQLSAASHFIYALLTAGLAASAARGMASDVRFVRAYLTMLLLPASVAEGIAGNFAIAAGIAGVFGFWVLRADQLNESYRSSREAGKPTPSQTTSNALLRKIGDQSSAPLRGIARMTVLLLDTPLTPDQREYLEIIRDSTSMLRHSMNNLLVGQTAGVQETFDPTAVLAGVADMFAPKAAAKRLELLATAGPGLSETLAGDPQRIGQALANLVSNAIKFTEQGRVEIHADCIEESGRRELCFEVCDSGSGIAPEKIPSLFETGMGLSIAAALTRQMGGSIGVESEPQRGSRFWLRLPIPVPVAEEVIATESARVPA